MHTKHMKTLTSGNSKYQYIVNYYRPIKYINNEVQ